MAKTEPAAMELWRWINDNNPDPSLEYGKGWWDYLEFLKLMIDKHDADRVEVLGTYEIETPPPCERLTLPVVRLRIGSTSFTLRHDFGAYPDAYIVSVERRTDYRERCFRLFDPDLDLRTSGVAGFRPEWVFPPFRQDRRRFTCRLHDEWDVHVLLTAFAERDQEAARGADPNGEKGSLDRR